MQVQILEGLEWQGKIYASFLSYEYKTINISDQGNNMTRT